MSYFSVTLDGLMREREWSRNEVALWAGVNRVQVSRWINDATPPDVSNVQRLCDSVDEADGDALMISYLRDQLSEKQKDRIRIDSGKPPSKSELASISKRLPEHVRKELEDLARMCESSPAAIDALLGLMRWHRGK